MIARLLLASTFSLLLACSTTSSGGGMMSGCLPNSTQLCWCSATEQGVQTCSAAGDAFSVCLCGAGLDGGASGDGKGSENKGSDSKAGDTTGGASADSQDSSAQDVSAQDVGSSGGADTSSEPDTDWTELLDPEDTAAPDSGSDAVAPNEACPERAKIIYVVTKGNQLLSFSPDQLQFKPVGSLNCPTGFADTPFSMAVDRQANAYVLFQSFSSGAGVFKVSTLDASCSTTNYQPNMNGFEVFGMGFSSDAPAVSDETLWIGGSKALSFQSGPCKLGTLDAVTMQTSTVAMIPPQYGCPDLTGNGQAQLFGFFPNANPPAVGEIDKQTAQIIKNWPLPASFATTQAWAFAQWGGKLWLFAMTSADTSTSVWSLDPLTGVTTKVMSNIDHVIVGAGVSSCAPTTGK